MALEGHMNHIRELQGVPGSTPSLANLQITFIGAGRIAQAMVEGLVAAGLSADQIHLTNRGNRERLNHLQSRWGVNVHLDKASAVDGAHVVVLAVKPADMAEAVAQVKPHLTGEPLLISVAAGITLAALAEWTEDRYALVRAMPNSSSRVLASATALAFDEKCNDEHKALAEALFRTIGSVVVVPEDQMDAVTGLSGSGPAYIYRLVEGLMEAGRMAGLPDHLTRRLSIETLYGAAHMLARTGQEPTELRQEVTSPGGTTAAGLAVLEAHGFTEALQQAVMAATRRAGELSNWYTNDSGEMVG
ncbi:MAG TPA: pyrroline-5-carboxylate reductase [Sphingobacteriaceae bacterium]|nr:pyrroline-5-carboxylate reductase [Sphingobacteriaceae bacterium]